MFLVTVDDKVAAYWGFSNYVLRNKLFFNSTGLMAKLSKFTTLIAKLSKFTSLMAKLSEFTTLMAKLSKFINLIKILLFCIGSI